MKKALNIAIVTLFVLLTYFLIINSISLFVSWIDEKSWWLAILLTIVLMFLFRPIFFHFPKIIISVLKYRYPTLIVTKIIDLCVTIFYLFTNMMLLFSDTMSNIKIVAIFLVLLFVFARTFKRGMMEYVLKYIQYPREQEFKDFDTWKYKIFFEHFL